MGLLRDENSEQKFSFFERTIQGYRGVKKIKLPNKIHLATVP